MWKKLFTDPSLATGVGAIATAIGSIFVLIGLIFTSCQIKSARETIQASTLYNIEKDFNDVFNAYLRGVTEKREKGQFVLSKEDAAAIINSLGRLIEILGAIREEGSLVLNVSDENRRTLHLALNCDQCGSEANGSKLKDPPKQIPELQKLMYVRCQGIQKLIKAGPISKDLVLQLERHMFYLRNITIVYLPT